MKFLGPSLQNIKSMKRNNSERNNSDRFKDFLFPQLQSDSNLLKYKQRLILDKPLQQDKNISQPENQRWK